ncbi:hypothetical protein COU54_03350 [Candidatus Pacearchaeota archaeon CG10_big_fil_rev_8_21_14_0_10_31_24]|nr:MAG: hypothetical protein COU54_03350 [Candidatus Pacearchaeota archaeon CG10_big_fil_rev_8_21_14_0_10_31_24]
MKIFIISDKHFHHENIIEYSNHPFKSVEEMDKEIIRRWNAKIVRELLNEITEEDIFYEMILDNVLNSNVLKNTYKPELSFYVVH